MRLTGSPFHCRRRSWFTVLRRATAATILPVLWGGLAASAAPQPPGSPAAAQPRVFQVTLVPATPAAAPAKATAKPARPPIDQNDAVWEWWVVGAFGALAFTVFRLWRLRPRHCPDCGARLIRLDREASFAELDAGERTEQLVGDVRYDVRRCSSCQRIVKVGQARGDLGRSAAPVGSAAHRRAALRTGLSMYTDAPPQHTDETPPPPS